MAKHACTITRPTARGDWYATLPAEAFGKNVETGPFLRVHEGTATVRFGGRGGAIIAATPDAARAALVVASVKAMRDAPAGYKNDARPGAIPSPIVALAAKAAKNLSQGAEVRVRLGRVPAARRVEVAPKILADARKA